jgi:hypothetical protein
LFLIPIVAALIGDDCQIAVYAPPRGTPQLRIRRGSRINRIEIKSLQINQDKPAIFPYCDTISTISLLESAVGDARPRCLITPEIWQIKWVLDIRDFVWNVFGPLFVLLAIVVGGRVCANVFTRAKL